MYKWLTRIYYKSTTRDMMSGCLYYLNSFLQLIYESHRILWWVESRKRLFKSLGSEFLLSHCMYCLRLSTLHINEWFVHILTKYRNIQSTVQGTTGLDVNIWCSLQKSIQLGALQINYGNISLDILWLRIKTYSLGCPRFWPRSWP